MSVYRRGHKFCWKCGARTVVFTWLGHEEWQKVHPPEPIPETIRWLYSNTIGERYWANACEHCGAIQGDWYLFYDHDDPVEWEAWGDDARAVIDAAWQRYGQAVGCTFREITGDLLREIVASGHLERFLREMEAATRYEKLLPDLRADGDFEQMAREWAADGARVAWKNGKFGAVYEAQSVQYWIELPGSEDTKRNGE